ncbi:DUF6263 family protein [Corynebacterium sp. HMSC29G08]|uniref:DUF6263 family protein n=1 Tax=Corynebacterium sp. HMSC29G08 TaxID=1581069 RepID=UPI0008CB15D0|nr:DUF6263 family protein [Corynebacterium sp. HMSC29G08]OFT83736.1 hypothetical protein HMPREF3101_05725 [Corynebacterium sp. HMSC29G08]
MLKNRLRACAAAVLALALTACGGTNDLLEGVPAFPVDAPQVNLVSPGDNPQVLTYQDAEEPWEANVVVSGGVAQTADPKDDASFNPTAPAGGDVMDTDLTLTVTSGPARAPQDGEEDAAREVELITRGGGHTDPDLGLEVAGNDGFTMRWRAADSGAVQSLKILPPVDSPEAGREVVERALLSVMNSTVVFPSEPVGVGGQWTVTTRVAGDAAMVRTTMYTVRAINGSEVQLDVDIEESPTQKELRIDNEVAGDLDGASLNVESASTTSTGELTVDLSKPLPTNGQIAATTRLVYAGDDTQFRIVQDVTNAVTYGK